MVNQVATKLNENLLCFLATLLIESVRVQMLNKFKSMFFVFLPR